MVDIVDDHSMVLGEFSPGPIEWLDRHSRYQDGRSIVIQIPLVGPYPKNYFSFSRYWFFRVGSTAAVCGGHKPVDVFRRSGATLSGKVHQRKNAVWLLFQAFKQPKAIQIVTIFTHFCNYLLFSFFRVKIISLEVAGRNKSKEQKLSCKTLIMRRNT